MKESGNDVSIGQYNRELPFFPNKTYVIEAADLGNLNLRAFMWIQAFFDAASVTSPQVVAWGGHYNADGTPQGNLIPFGYSGHIIQFKGKGLLTSAVDCRGVTQTSTPFGVAPTQIRRVVVYGGAI